MKVRKLVTEWNEGSEWLFFFFFSFSFLQFFFFYFGWNKSKWKESQMCASESLKGRRPWPWRTSGISAERSRLCAFIKGRLFVTLLLSAAAGPFYLLRLCVDFFSFLLIAVKKRPLSRKSTINTNAASTWWACLPSCHLCVYFCRFLWFKKYIFLRLQKFISLICSKASISTHLLNYSWAGGEGGLQFTPW